MTPDLPSDPTIIEAQTAFGDVLRTLEGLLGVTGHHWNGRIVWEEFGTAYGMVHPDGTVGLFRPIWDAGGAVRYRTLVHEALHTFSFPSLTEYRAMTGWEEGVVEQLQRILRQEVFELLGLSIPESDFLLRDANHAYNEYIDALETLRSTLGADDRGFYLDLITVPLASRLRRIEAVANSLPDLERQGFRVTLALANARLRRRVHGF